MPENARNPHTEKQACLLPTPPIRLVNSAELAGLLGVSAAAVTRARKAARIIPHSNNAQGHPLWDPVATIAQWRSNSAPRSDGPDFEKLDASSASDLRRELTAQKLRRERALADQEELQAAKAAGTLLELAGVEFALYHLATAINRDLDELPGRVAPLVAHDADGVHRASKVLTAWTETARENLHIAMLDATDKCPLTFDPSGILARVNGHE